MKYNFKLSALAFGIAALTIVAGQVQSQNQPQNCAPRDFILQQLADRFGEERQSVGLGSNNTLVEVFASSKTGTWSVLATRANGVTCLIASGHSHETVSAAATNTDPKT